MQDHNTGKIIKERFGIKLGEDPNNGFSERFGSS